MPLRVFFNARISILVPLSNMFSFAHVQRRKRNLTFPKNDPNVRLRLLGHTVFRRLHCLDFCMITSSYSVFEKVSLITDDQPSF